MDNFDRQSARGRVDSVHQAAEEVRAILQKHEIVEGLVQRQEMPRQDLVENLVQKQNFMYKQMELWLQKQVLVLLETSVQLVELFLGISVQRVELFLGISVQRVELFLET